MYCTKKLGRADSQCLAPKRTIRGVREPCLCISDLLEDTDMGDGKRWLLIAPKGSTGTAIVLAEAKTNKEKRIVGNQGAGRVWLFLHTDDFYRDYDKYRNGGVQFLEEPRTEPYGTVAVFIDTFGNKWDLLQPNQN